MRQDIVWVDSHCHLEMLKGSVDKVLERSVQAGMIFCITIGTSHTSNQLVPKYCRGFEQVFGTLGCHPHNASEFKSSHLDWMKQEIERNNKIVGIGECGFDLYYEHSRRDQQKIAFEAQLDLAEEVGLPVVIHSRDADKMTREVLDYYKGKNISGVVHSITSDIDQAKYLLDLGFYLSFNGICTFPQAEPVREVLKYTPLDRILLETDSPYLSPDPLRGKSNVPGNVAIIGKFVADFLKVSQEELSEQVLRNTSTLFSKIIYEN